MDRRAFITMVSGSIFAAPLAGEGQQGRRVYRIGVLHTGFVPIIPAVEGLQAGLKSAGLEEGRDVVLDTHFTRGKAEAVATMVAALLGSRPDVIFTEGEEATLTVKNATSAIPIVFVDVGDPVAAGIVASISHPGGNITGVSGLITELVPKRLEILKTLIPTVRRIWFAYHADDLSSRAAARTAADVTLRLKIELVDRAVRTQDELIAQFRGIKLGDALLSPQAVTLNIPGIVLDLQLFNRVPAVFANTFWVQGGGLIGYGADVTAEGLQAARLVAKILHGTKPQDLPVEGANKIELGINLKAARSLGISVPSDLLLRAEYVVK